MQEKCMYDSTMYFWFNENLLPFPALSFILLSNNIYKFSHLQSFHFEISSLKFYISMLSLHFKHFTFQKLLYISCLYLQVFILRTPFLLKVILQISCIKRFLHISNFYVPEILYINCFVSRNHLLHFYAVLHVFTINIYSCKLVSRTYILITPLDP